MMGFDKLVSFQYLGQLGIQVTVLEMSHTFIKDEQGNPTQVYEPI